MNHSETMSHRFKTRIDDLRENDPSSSGEEVETSYTKFETTGHARNLIFIWADKQERNCQYTYLVNTCFKPAEGTITFNFTDQTITIVGSNLNQLHRDLRYQLPEEIRQTSPRYAAIAESDECIITDIIVTPHKG